MEISELIFLNCLKNSYCDKDDYDCSCDREYDCGCDDHIW